MLRLWKSLFKNCVLKMVVLVDKVTAEHQNVNNYILRHSLLTSFRQPLSTAEMPKLHLMNTVFTQNPQTLLLRLLINI